MIMNIDTDKDRGICRACKEPILQGETLLVLGFGRTIQTLHKRCEEKFAKAVTKFARNVEWQHP